MTGGMASTCGRCEGVSSRGLNVEAAIAYVRIEMGSLWMYGVLR